MSCLEITKVFNSFIFILRELLIEKELSEEDFFVRFIILDRIHEGQSSRLQSLFSSENFHRSLNILNQLLNGESDAETRSHSERNYSCGNYP